MSTESESYHCKYCHCRMPTKTALNRHIAHSAVCFSAYQDDILRLTSTNTGADGSITSRSGTMDNFMPPDSLVNDCEVEAEVLIPEQTAPAPKKKVHQRSEDSDDVENVNDPHSQSRYWRGYPVGHAGKVLG